MHYDHVGFQIEQVVTFGAPKVRGCPEQSSAHVPLSGMMLRGRPLQHEYLY